MNLPPCPFCGAGTTEIEPSYYWTGKRNTVISVVIKHWCNRQDGQPQSFLQIKGTTEEDAIKTWNKRTPPPEPEQKVNY